MLLLYMNMVAKAKYKILFPSISQKGLVTIFSFCSYQILHTLRIPNWYGMSLWQISVLFSKYFASKTTVIGKYLTLLEMDFRLRYEPQFLTAIFTFVSKIRGKKNVVRVPSYLEAHKAILCHDSKMSGKVQRAALP